MKAGWHKLPFDEAVVDESGGNLKTPQREFLAEGEFAVIDQGKELVSGYVNDRTRLCRSALPVVVFGDHTRCLKFVDFPFCMGADGIKVLRPKVNADVKYLYHYLRQLRLYDGGYDRHFKYLKRAEVVLPPLAEQRRIAEVLDRAEALRAKRRAALAQLDSLTQSLFLDLFGDPATNAKGFPTMPLASLVRDDDTINYGVVQPGDDLDEGVSLVRVGDLIDGKVKHSDLKRIAPSIEAAYKRSRLRGHEVLLVCVGATAGLVAIADETVRGFNIARAIARIPLADGSDPIFVAAYLRTDRAQRHFQNELRTVAQPTLNIKQICELPVVYPPLERQREFARRVRAVEKLKRAQRASLAELDALFATLQHRAFRGEL